VMSKDGMKLVGHFAKPRPEGESEFDGISYEEKTLGVPVLTDALAYLECKVHSTHDAGDHTLVFGEVVNGQVQKDGEPATHVRKNGFSY
ncbi:MAG: flavin reductase family protein, partial [Candidatus Sericytochromatia bacterium]